MKINLHSHSLQSDGQYSINDLLTKADAIGCDYFAVTDHDVASDYSHQVTSNGMKLIRGVEITANYNGNLVHVLYYYDKGHELNELLKNNHDAYNARANKIISALNTKLKLNMSLDKVMCFSNKDYVTRLDIAKYLVSENIFINEKFVYLRCFRNIEKFGLEGIIDYTKLRQISQHGFLLLAHPQRYSFYLDSLLKDLINIGLKGFEFSPNESFSKEDYKCIKSSFKNGCVISLGTDFHSDKRKDTLVTNSSIKNRAECKYNDIARMADLYALLDLAT
ncbi:PHP domain-containing protein [Vibrio splendidus]